MTGKFIVFEGIEGAGKSTVIEQSAEYLERHGKRVIVTREPGGTTVAEAIRRLLLDPQNAEQLDSATELLLVFAARQSHLDRVIYPYLNLGYWVLCTRFTGSTYAYQGFGRGLGSLRIAQLETFVQGQFRPDMSILLDVPVEVAFQRLLQRGMSLDRFEREPEEFFSKVRAGFLEIASKGWSIVDATQPLEAVLTDVNKILDALIATS